MFSRIPNEGSGNFLVTNSTLLLSGFIPIGFETTGVVLADYMKNKITPMLRIIRNCIPNFELETDINYFVSLKSHC